MTKAKQQVSLALMILAAAVVAATGVMAQRAYRVSDRQVETLLNRIEMRTDTFRVSLNNALNRNRSGANRADEIQDAVRRFEAATDRLRERFNGRRDASADAQDTLSRAGRVDSLISRMTLNARARNDWNALRSDLNLLANHYNISWRWDGTQSPANNAAYPGLTGTWRLDPSSSDNVDQVIDRALRGLSSAEQPRLRESLRRRLEPPDAIAIEQRNRRFTLASTRAPQITFDATGRSQTEHMGNRAVRVTASTYGDQLVVNTTGNRGNDFHITFDPIDNGQDLRVTRRVSVERLSQPLVITSVYDRTSNVAQLDLYRGDVGIDDRRDRARGPFLVPNGAQLVAALDNTLDTKQARAGDRFSMTVRSPAQYNGAVIEGTVLESDRAGRLTGRSEMTLDFERIRARDGAAYDFDGYIVSVNTPGGDNEVRVDNEGAIREEDSQTDRTITRTGIGAAIGAIIGAIAGGGSGAAIGAAVGAGAGAGSVYIQGREDLELPSGTQVTIRSSAPRLREARR